MQSGHSGLTHVVDVLPEGLGPTPSVISHLHNQRVRYILFLTWRADVNTPRMDGVPLRLTDNSILTEEKT